MIALPVTRCDAATAAARGRALVRDLDDSRAGICASVVHGPVTVLGARQRPAAVLSSGPWIHRATTGAEAHIAGAAVWWSLALPSVRTLFPDATTDTLLNRNVRGFLRGFTACGALAHFFGRDVISVRHRTGAILGYDVLDDGRVLLDVIAGWTDALSLPDGSRAELRRDGPRPEGVALQGLVQGRQPEAFAQAVMEAVAVRAQQRLEHVGERAIDGAAPTWVEPAEVGSVRVPIGWVEAGVVRGAPWLGGDLLASTAWLHRAELALARGEPLPTDAVIHGARPEDLLQAWRSRTGLSP